MADEDIVKRLVWNRLSADFILLPEVRGELRFDSEIRRKRIDFMAYPKDHLIQKGFDAGWIGIETKSLFSNGKRSEGNWVKQRNLLWQCLGYSLSQFIVAGTSIRPMFVLACIDAEPIAGESSYEGWKELISFIQRAHVGLFELMPEWRIRFGPIQAYYSEKGGKCAVPNLGKKDWW
jgi:hypothetical protein